MKFKKDLYKNEQTEIIDKIINIIKLDNNNSFILYEFDNDMEKQEKIYELTAEIKLYFRVGSVKSLIYPEKMKRVYLSIIKLVLKDGYNIFSKDYKMIKNEIVIRTKKYFFIKKINA